MSMKREQFERIVKASPQYWRLIFSYGINLFLFDEHLDQYRNLAIQIAYEVWCDGKFPT